MNELHLRAIEIIKEHRRILKMLDDHKDIKNSMKIHSSIVDEITLFVEFFSKDEDFNKEEFRKLCWSKL